MKIDYSHKILHILKSQKIIKNKLSSYLAGIL
jgi:hypothetical protein